MRYLVLGVPGLAPLIAEELGGDLSGNDGHSDVVVVERPDRVFRTRLGQHVLVEITNTATRRPLRSVLVDVRHALSGTPMERALSTWAAWRGPLSASRMTYRVAVRLLSEEAFRRIELRDTLAAEIGKTRPAWRGADPADIEVWAIEDRPGRLRIGLRLSVGELGSREIGAGERQAALPSTLAAAMVHLSGEPSGTLVDPCCGPGTILGEAAAAGWESTAGGDTDAVAVATAARNLPGPLWVGEATSMPLADGAAGAVVTSVPVGERHLREKPRPWLEALLAEASRVTEGGPVVLLSPRSRHVDAVVDSGGLELVRSLDVRLPGRRATIYRLGRS